MEVKVEVAGDARGEQVLKTGEGGRNVCFVFFLALKDATKV